MKSGRTVILGTRGSELALTQSSMVAQKLREQGLDVELKVIKTEGDVTAKSLSQLGGIGVFAAALRLALLNGECDIAVHSFKDLPTARVSGLDIGAVPRGVNPRDVLCARDGLRLRELPQSAQVGTGSPRRAAQILALRPDLEMVDIRGNIGTRLARVKGGGVAHLGDLDAVVLARAGLERLGRLDVITDELEILPAPAQGRLAVECRSADTPWNSRSALALALGAINDLRSRASAFAERAVLAGLKAGCAAPVGVTVNDGSLCAGVFAADGSESRIVQVDYDFGKFETGSESDDKTALLAGVMVNLDQEMENLGKEVAGELITRGAAQIADLQAVKARGSVSGEVAKTQSATRRGVDDLGVSGESALAGGKMLQAQAQAQVEAKVKAQAQPDSRLWPKGISGPNDEGADISARIEPTQS